MNVYYTAYMIVHFLPRTVSVSVASADIEARGAAEESIRGVALDAAALLRDFGHADFGAAAGNSDPEKEFVARAPDLACACMLVLETFGNANCKEFYRARALGLRGGYAQPLVQTGNLCLSRAPQ